MCVILLPLFLWRTLIQKIGTECECTAAVNTYKYRRIWVWVTGRDWRS